MMITTVKARHPVREELSGCSTGSGGPYYPTKGDAISAYKSALAEWGLCFNPDDLMDMPGDFGCVTIDVCNDELECSARVGSALLAWYRMPSGRYEFTGYLT